jgi:hypothetical protein
MPVLPGSVKALQSTVLSAGQVMVGAVALKVTVLVQVPEPQPLLVVVKDSMKVPLEPGTTATCWPVAVVTPPSKVPLPVMVQS